MTYEKYLNKTVDKLFQAAYEDNLTWSEFADKARVSKQTVYNLGTRKTRFPQLRTVFRLAKAVNINLPEVLKQRLQKAA